MEQVADFHNAVQRDLAWRKREISNLRVSAASSEDSATHLYRSGLVLLCAHWEGFLKKGCETLHRSCVFTKKKKLRELNPVFVSVALFDDVMAAAASRYPGSPDHHLKLARKILAHINRRVVKMGWNVDTEGNPGSQVLERILATVGLSRTLGMDAATWATTKVFINEQLVRDRHQIAHGEGTVIQKDSLLERTDRLMTLLDIISNLILDAAQNRSYLN